MRAVYYNADLSARAFEVLKDHGNGMVDIGTGKTLVVGGAQVVNEPKAGCVTLGEDVPAAKETPPASAPAETAGEAKAKKAK